MLLLKKVVDDQILIQGFAGFLESQNRFIYQLSHNNQHENVSLAGKRNIRLERFFFPYVSQKVT
jgi:hypothetical protein